MLNFYSLGAVGYATKIAILFGDTPGYNWELKVGNLNGQTASTNPYDKVNKLSVTTFDTKSWPDATDLSFARTILHESFHAYLSSFFANDRSGFIKTYPEQVSDYAIYSNWNIVHHEDFARSIVRQIGNDLENYGLLKGYSYSSQFYQDLAWGGLEGTTTFKNLPEGDRNRIHDVVNIELIGKDFQGIIKNQNGTKINCP